MHHLQLALSGLVLISACLEPQPSVTLQTAPVASCGNAARADEFRRSKALALCDRAQRCAEEGRQSWTSPESCTAAWLHDEEVQRLVVGSSAESRWYAREFTLVEDRATACVQALRDAPCDAYPYTEDCHRAVVPCVPAGEGEACDLDHGQSSCDRALTCAVPQGEACGQCERRREEGGRCTTYVDCKSLNCDVAAGTCAGPLRGAAEGARCGSHGWCGEGLACVQAADNEGVCKRRVAAGGSCADAASVCLQGLECVLGTCTALLAAGQPCSRGPDQGRCEGYCRYPDSAAATGVCSSALPEVHDGDPCCGVRSWSLCPVEFHAITTWADQAETSCRCILPVATGGSCAVDDACESYHCQDGTCRAARTPQEPLCAASGE